MILCCGESLIDMLPRETGAGEDAFAPYPGGSVFNTAIALGRLGAPVSFFSGVSSDLFGQRLVESLTASRVSTDQLARSDRPTTLAFVMLTDGHAQYAFYDENTAGRMITEADLPETDAEALFFGGISLVVEPCAETYASLLTREAERALIMVDPNIRPGFITDEAAYRTRLAGIFDHCDIVKISDEDLDWLSGDADPQKLFDGTAVQLVLLTRGAKGVSIVTREASVEVPAVTAEVVDTVGAGDTFSAGFLEGLRRDGLLSKEAVAGAGAEDFRAATELGAQAAAVTVSRAGANPPWSHEL